MSISTEALAGVPSLAEAAAPSYQHLLAMTDDIGIFEHALFDAPRIEHGYCVDDVSRALIVGAREPVPSDELRAATATYLDFVDAAGTGDGRVHNRCNVEGMWTDKPTVGDWWGRAIWASGIAATTMSSHTHQEQARAIALRAMQQSSPFVRTNVFAALGAAELLMQIPEDTLTRRFLQDAVSKIPRSPLPQWDWPEETLKYANGSYVEAILAAGEALDDVALVGRGLELLAFLLDLESDGRRFSVTGVGGSSPQSPRPQFDQQPIEVAALADACVRAFAITGDVGWLDGVEMAWAWFEGQNDSQVRMYDPATGAGFDGLERGGRNENRGAESTLAVLTTHQHVLRLYSLMEGRS